MPAPAFNVRSMTDNIGDLDGALGLSQAVGWPYRRDDWNLALSLGHGLLGQQGDDIVGSALWWTYGATLATCGIIIVSPDRQGLGLGRTLMRGMMDAIGDRTALLNSTLEGRRLYESIGFSEIGTVHQHQAQTLPDAFQNAAIKNAPVRRATPGDLPDILQMDQDAFGAERTRLIEMFSLVGVGAVMERDGVIQGFALCRRFGHGHAIGPVIARTADDAKALIRYFLAMKAGEFLRIDVTGDSGLGDWLAALGLPEVGDVTTMIRGQAPHLTGQGRIFALASQSFG
ncbi:MAG: GNAT family N-acetyltransferase [Sphingobium sp.]